MHTSIKPVLLAVALMLLSSLAFAQQAQPLTVTLSPQEAQAIATWSSHEIQLACMFGQCAAAGTVTMTIPAKLAAAEKAAQVKAAQAKPAKKDKFK